MLVFAAIMPHPPESIPGIGNEDDFKAIEKTLHSFDELRKGIENSDPDTVIIISPHAHLEQYSFVINSSSILKGSFVDFGLDDIYEYENNIVFANKLAFAGLMNDLPTHLHESFLDHGALIPIHHLLENIKPKIVHLSFSLMDYHRQYFYGEIIQRVIDMGSGGRVAVVASADLSHKLTPISPAGFSPGALKFDRDILHFLGAYDKASILGLQPEALAEAAECGVRSIIILLGILHGRKHEFNLLSYEYPFGIGYMTARLL
ncbi:MAG: hypothetical protein US63_C0042G0009 [Candidatus Moranbacteria bacterium GW2011_GWC2_37_8]|nr:MAG: hypothetical protein US63_C0042G0009 [Candidatus Moranbacteria bacterium GW2011_GWC2_37_8]KKQ60740.1 MAG: hypothetical protein US82_C0029G0005 [Parcubacteria group bacterium GW2011_GWC1_38_22]KKQ81436.1 MAG: hypothetical protein UT03_C0002G0010 [Candidatus Moranbacteria bacterium GW2011_GWD2_38_7]